MALAIVFLQRLVSILDEAYSHGLRPARDLRAVSSQGVGYVVQKTALLVEGIVSQIVRSYSPDLSFSETGEPVPVPEVPEPPAEPSVELDVDALPDGWTDKMDAWFTSVKDHYEDAHEEVVYKVSDRIHAILRAHSISAPYAGEGTIPSAAVRRAPVAVPHTTTPAPAAAPISSRAAAEGPPSPLAAPTIADASTIPSATGQAAILKLSPLLVPADVDDAMNVDTTPSPASTPSLASASPRPCASPEELPLTTPVVAALETFARPPLLPVSTAIQPSSPPDVDSPTLATPISAHTLSEVLAHLAESYEPPGVPVGMPFRGDYPLHLEAVGSPRKTPPPFGLAISSSARATSPPRASSPATSLASEPTMHFACPPPAPPPPSSPFVTVMHAVAGCCGRFDLILLLSHICAPLRNTLLGDPELWTRLALHSAASVDVFDSLIARSARDSKRRLLHLDLVLRSPAHIEDLLGSLGDALPRARHLAISLDNPKLAMFGRAFKNLMELRASPDLTSLHLLFRAEGRPTTIFGGTAGIARLTCQLWQLQRVPRAHLAKVREFVALRPPRDVDQKSHAAAQVFKMLPNAQTLVLAYPLNDQRNLQLAKGWRPLQCLVLDQRTGPAIWHEGITSQTLDSIQEHLIEVVVIVRALGGTTNLVRERLSESLGATRAGVEMPEVALFGLGGAIHCALSSSMPPRARIFVDASSAVLCALRIRWVFVRELHVAAHMPPDALEVLLTAPAPNLCALTVWVNAAADGLHSLLALRDRRFEIGTTLQELRLVARAPVLPAVCDRFIATDWIPAPPPTCTVAAADLSEFFAFHRWNVEHVTIVLGDRVEITGARPAVDGLFAQVAGVVRENV